MGCFVKISNSKNNEYLKTYKKNLKRSPGVYYLINGKTILDEYSNDWYMSYTLMEDVLSKKFGLYNRKEAITEETGNERIWEIKQENIDNVNAYIPQNKWEVCLKNWIIFWYDHFKDKGKVYLSDD